MTSDLRVIFYRCEHSGQSLFYTNTCCNVLSSLWPWHTQKKDSHWYSVSLNSTNMVNFCLLHQCISVYVYVVCLKKKCGDGSSLFIANKLCLKSNYFIYQKYALQVVGKFYKLYYSLHFHISLNHRNGCFLCSDYFVDNF